MSGYQMSAESMKAAANLYGNVAVQRQAGLAQSGTSQIDTINNRLEETSRMMYEMIEKVTFMADRVVGPIPPAEGRVQSFVTPTTTTEYLEQIADRMTDLRRAIDRIA